MPARAATRAQSPHLAGVAAELDDLIRLHLHAHVLDLSAGRRSPDPFTGGHLSRFRARGMEYAESRAYLPGDDIRNMDWRVTARTGRPHTKLFQEERERPVILIVDLSPSMFFGTRVAFKSVLASHAAALVAWAAMQRGDRIGALICAPTSHREVRPAGGRRGVLRALRALSALARFDHEAGGAGESRLEEAVVKARRVVRPGSLVFLFSDFYDLDTEVERQLARLGRHTDLVGCWVYDPLEADPPPPGRYAISDGRDIALLNTGAAQLVDAYRRHFGERRARIHEAFGRLGALLISLETGRSVEDALRHGLSGAPRIQKTERAA